MVGIKVKKTVFSFFPSQIYYSQLCCIGLEVSNVIYLRKHIKLIKDTLRGEVKKVEKSKSIEIELIINQNSPLDKTPVRIPAPAI